MVKRNASDLASSDMRFLYADNLCSSSLSAAGIEGCSTVGRGEVRTEYLRWGENGVPRMGLERSSKDEISTEFQR